MAVSIERTDLIELAEKYVKGKEGKTEIAQDFAEANKIRQEEYTKRIVLYLVRWDNNILYTPEAKFIKLLYRESFSVPLTIKRITHELQVTRTTAIKMIDNYVQEGVIEYFNFGNQRVYILSRELREKAYGSW